MYIGIEVPYLSDWTRCIGSGHSRPVAQINPQTPHLMCRMTPFTTPLMLSIQVNKLALRVMPQRQAQKCSVQPAQLFKLFRNPLVLHAACRP